MLLLPSLIAVSLSYSVSSWPTFRQPRHSKVVLTTCKWLPADADERTLKQRFRTLSRQLHPDLNKDDAEAQEQFVALSIEYKRLLDECRSQQQRSELEASWLQLGGIGAAAALLFSATPLVPAAVAAAVGAAQMRHWIPSIHELTQAAEQAERAERAAKAAELEACTALEQATAASSTAARQTDAARRAAEVASARWRASTLSAQRAAAAARRASLQHRLACWSLRLRGVLTLRSETAVLQGVDSMGNSSVALLRVAMPWSNRTSRASVRTILHRLDERLRDACAAQAMALASLDAAATEARVRSAEASTAEDAQDQSADAVAAAQRAAAHRVTVLEQARQEHIERRQTVANWGATQADARAVAQSVGGLAESIAGATSDVTAGLLGSIFGRREGRAKGKGKQRENDVDVYDV